MINTEKTVKIYDIEKNLIGKGHLLGMSDSIIKVKGRNLPILDSKEEIIVEIYHDFSGICTYYCTVSVAASDQLNALIKKCDSIIERRKSLKVRTDLSFYINSLWRNDEDITKDVPNMQINVLNLSIGGMLISSNYNLEIGDIITFNFQYEKHQAVLLKAKIIRIDKIYDEITKKLSVPNYGCCFDKLNSIDEAAITKYLYDRQLKLYRNK
jgi:c-di-GMP-binding flagellar brake protein YcgR